MFSSNSPLLDARLTGVIEGSFNIVSEGTVDGDYKYKEFYYNFNFTDTENDAGFFNGIQIKTWGANKFDKVELSTEYYVPPMSAWLRYKKFGKNFYVWDDFSQPIVLFPTTPKTGVRLKIKYITKKTNTGIVDFVANGWIFVDQQIVDINTAQQGTDW